MEDGIAPMKDVVNDIRFATNKGQKGRLFLPNFKKNEGPGKSLDDIARINGSYCSGGYTD